MAQLINNTPFAARYVLLPNEKGIDTLYVMVKAAFNIGAVWTLCDKQHAPLSEDIYWGEPGQSSLKYPTDVHQGKPSTDIAVQGSSYAPGNNPVHTQEVSAAIGHYKKTLCVFGDRCWQQGRISPPEPFTRMPIRYENAFGGQHRVHTELKSLEPRNPVGKGYRGAREPAEMKGQPLPNIEDPTHLVRHMDDTPAPAGFGFIAPNWHPRAMYAGTYDDQWLRNRAPYLPLDYQARAQNSAQNDFVCSEYLSGGEAVTLTGMHPEGDIHFVLPQINLNGSIRLNGLPRQTLQFMMETLLIDADAMQLNMTWKAAYCCNTAFPQIRTVRVYLSR